MTKDARNSLQASKPKQAVAVIWSCVVAGGIALFMAAVAGPKLIASKFHGNEAAAIGALKTIGTSQQLYREQGHSTYADLAQLNAANLVDPVLGSGSKQGYVFECRASTASPSSAWWASAIPQEPGSTGRRYLALNHEGVVYYGQTAPLEVDPATCAMPPGALPLGR